MIDLDYSSFGQLLGDLNPDPPSAVNEANLGSDDSWDTMDEDDYNDEANVDWQFWLSAISALITSFPGSLTCRLT